MMVQVFRLPLHRRVVWIWLAISAPVSSFVPFIDRWSLHQSIYGSSTIESRTKYGTSSLNDSDTNAFDHQHHDSVPSIIDEGSWVDDSQSSSNSNNDTDNNKAAARMDLIDSLGEAFQYEGRLRGGNRHDSDYRCGFVSILGAPNMGKSTLLNALLEEDICITTARPQTTRHAILGILTTAKAQVCLIDTPGIIDQPAYKLQEGMMEAVIGAFHDADVLLVVSDLFSTPIPSDNLFHKVQTSRKPCIVVINKIDLANKVQADTNHNPISGKTVTVQAAIAKWRTLLPQALMILPCNARQGRTDPGVAALRRILVGGPDVTTALQRSGPSLLGMFPPHVDAFSDTDAQALLPISPPLYGDDALTDRSERFISSEIIRAALFETLKKELPYCCEVQVTAFKDPAVIVNNSMSRSFVVNNSSGKKPVLRIEATIFVERNTQKIIVIGKNGQQIKKIGTIARQKLEEFFQQQVFLDLSVKVDKDWRSKEDKLKAFGYLNP